MAIPKIDLGLVPFRADPPPWAVLTGNGAVPLVSYSATIPYRADPPPWATLAALPSPLSATAEPDPSPGPYIVVEELDPIPGEIEVLRDHTIFIPSAERVLDSDTGSAVVDMASPPVTSPDQLTAIDDSRTVIRVKVGGAAWLVVYESGAGQAGWTALATQNAYAGWSYLLATPTLFDANTIIQVEVTVEDFAGRMASETYSFTTVMDATPPQVINRSPGEGGTIGKKDALTFSIMDNIGVNPGSVAVWINGRPVYSYLAGFVGGWSRSTIIGNPAINGYDLAVYPDRGWSGQSFTVRVLARDFTGLVCDVTWTFRRADAPYSFKIYPMLVSGIRLADEDED